MSHEIPPYNTLMSQDQKRNMPQMQIAYLKHSYVFPGTESTVWTTKTPSSSLTKPAALQTSMKHFTLIVTFRPCSSPTLRDLRWIWPTTFACLEPTAGETPAAPTDRVKPFVWQTHPH